ncbi:methyltransferase domain-containing protein [Altibacter sp. HG106]|uniref:methyltransferase domain-containing protein n=1 Tax=Altibacter sp. HG106 TaxID=3023937 RepID=UPI002350460A|nr:methyltransferase domain-containing protein [Altibacter sp. HG106]MDC7993518.1 methyltransferase domain-containing protein [Altibacter sp. HG106]
MDDFELHGAEMQQLLTDLKTVNRLLGGNEVTLSGIEQLLPKHPLTRPITILDVGCGDGEMLRQCARYFRSKNQEIKCLGIDANPHILEEAATRSADFQNIRFQKHDVFSTNASLPPFDIACCTLFLHHFKNDQIRLLLQQFSEQAALGVVVNDLARNRWAFELFKLFGSLFLKSKIAKHDGLVSVARGFKKEELLELSNTIEGHHQITLKWAFRYQWIITKL